MITIGMFALGPMLILSAAPIQYELLAPRVRLSLSTDDGSLYERATLSFSIDVENVTQEHLAINLVLQPVWRKFVRVLYRRLPDEFSELTYTSEWDIPGHAYLIPFRLDGGDKKGFPLSIAVDPGRGSFVFDRPGTYELKVICDVTRNIYAPKDVLETPPLHVRVEPAPPSEAAALEDWDVELAIFAQNDGGEGGPRFREVLPRALKFMDDHPASLYAQPLRKRSLGTLMMLKREGAKLTDYERDAFERLRQPPLPR